MFKFAILALSFLGSIPALAQNTPEQTKSGWLEDDKTGCLYVEGESEKKYQERLIKERNKRNNDLIVIFSTADTNQDNKVSVEEAVKAGFGRKFTQYDYNGNRFIEPYEINLWLKYNLAEQFWQSFAKIDKDMSGGLDDLEIMISARPLYSRFTELDKDGNKTIDLDEFSKSIHPKIAETQWFKNALSIVKEKNKR